MPGRQLVFEWADSVISMSYHNQVTALSEHYATTRREDWIERAMVRYRDKGRVCTLGLRGYKNGHGWSAE